MSSLSKIYTDDKKETEWLDYLKQLVTSTEEGAPYDNVAAEFQKAGKLADGVAFLESLAAKREKDQPLMMTLAHWSAEAGQPEKAVEIYKKMLAQDEQQPFVHYSLAGLYEKINKPDEALEEYSKCLEPRDVPPVRLKYAALLEKQGKKTEALAEYRKVAEADPANEEARAGITRLEANPESTGAPGASPPEEPKEGAAPAPVAPPAPGTAEGGK